MRMPLPSADVRARVLQGLHSFYQTEKRVYLRTALGEWAAFYKVPAPTIELRRLRKEGDTFILGKTWNENVIALWPPRSWKAMTVAVKDCNWTAAGWVSTALHELAHALWFVQAERKADLYARRFVRKDA